MKRSKLLVALLLVLVMVVPLVLTACNKPNNPNNPGDITNDVADPLDDTSVYDKIGSKVNIGMVQEDKLSGLSYVTYEGTKYELGLDFLSKAMVQNITAPKSGAWAGKSSTEIYNEWWRLYIQRWNYVVPEVPLYSNKYYDAYYATIGEFYTTPFWGTTSALMSATSSSTVIVGDVTQLDSNFFRDSSFGKPSPGASDMNVVDMTTGYSTVYVDMNGSMQYAPSYIATHEISDPDSQGNVTYTFSIAKNLKFSNGDAITAKNYVYSVLAYSTPVMAEAGGGDTAGKYYVGYESFNTNAKGGSSATFSGIKLLDDYKFSVTVKAEYASSYYAMQYASFTPVHKDLLFKGADVDVKVASDKSCYISEAFYVKNSSGTYTMAETIKSQMTKWSADEIPYSGPYYVSAYNQSEDKVTLTKNSRYLGDYRTATTQDKGDGVYEKVNVETPQAPKINTIEIGLAEAGTQQSQFEDGNFHILAGVSGKEESNAIIELVNKSNGRYKITSYYRAGYGNLALIGDCSPTQFVEVRQAIMYTLNRNEFNDTYAGAEHSKLVHGPYYEGFSMYQANKDKLKLNTYDYSTANAITVLEKGGWTYNSKGEAYKTGDGVRYKKLEKSEQTLYNLKFESTDGKHKTVKIGDSYYMPLVINWYGSEGNPVSALLASSWKGSQGVTTIGMYVTQSTVDFTQLLSAMSRLDLAEGQAPKLNAANLATGFTSAMFDYSKYWTIKEEDFYTMNGSWRDYADFYCNYSK